MPQDDAPTQQIWNGIGWRYGDPTCVPEGGCILTASAIPSAGRHDPAEYPTSCLNHHGCSKIIPARGTDPFGRKWHTQWYAESARSRFSAESPYKLLVKFKDTDSASCTTFGDPDQRVYSDWMASSGMNQR